MSLNVRIFCDTIMMRYSVCKLLQALSLCEKVLCRAFFIPVPADGLGGKSFFSALHVCAVLLF